MNNNPEMDGSKEQVCFRYDGLVGALTERLVVDEKIIFPDDGKSSIDHEDILSWIKAVKFKDNQVPSIRVVLMKEMVQMNERGSASVTFNTRDVNPIESLDEKVSPQRLMYSLALTEAKMKVISDIAEDVYPAVADQIKDYEREFAAARNEMLGIDQSLLSMNQVWNRAGLASRVGLAVVALGFVSAACSAALPERFSPETQSPVVAAETMPAEATPVEELVPTFTVEPTNAPTEIPTAEPTVEPTVEVAPAYAPEGFSVGEYGLLKDPETGRDVMVLNPEADWSRFREETIKGIWQSNVDWCKFTGECNEAMNYPSAEAFYDAAITGKTFKIGIPVRSGINGSDIDKEKSAMFTWKYLPSMVVLKTVEVRLDEIVVQALEADSFRDYLGGANYLDEGMEAFSPFPTATESKMFDGNTIHYTVNKAGELVISVGSYNDKNEILFPSQYWVGGFESEGGIGDQADMALSHFLGYTSLELGKFSAGELIAKMLDGSSVKYVSLTIISQQVPDGDWYLEPPLFSFAE
jgi:hypothetical protein